MVPIPQHQRVLRAFASSLEDTTTTALQAQLQHCMDGICDGDLIAALEAVLQDATFAGHDRPERVLEYRPVQDLLHRLRQLRLTQLREAIVVGCQLSVVGCQAADTAADHPAGQRTTDNRQLTTDN